MNGLKLKRLAIIVSIVLLLTISGCAGAPSSPSPTPTNAPGVTATPTPTPKQGLAKPKPVVLEVTAGTGGMGESYYAILDITVRNEGADGTAIVVASITQGATTLKNEFPVYLPHNDKQTVRLIFPLKWKGGEFTPSVTVEVP